MIYSMTGYGRAVYESPQARVTLEVKSVNGRYLDLNFRLPRELSHLEPALRNAARARLARGRVEASVNLQLTDAGQYGLNTAAVDHYIRVADGLRDRLSGGAPLDAATLLQLPGVIEVRALELASDESLARGVLCAFEEALEGLARMRQEEGAALGREIASRVEQVRRRVPEILPHCEQIQQAARQKLTQRLAHLAPELEFDPIRVAQEVVLYVERSDVTEEVIRMQSHLAQMGAALQSGGEIGKKMDFLLQEMGREVNTTLAKSSSPELSEIGVWIKGELEKIREQIQNVE